VQGNDPAALPFGACGPANTARSVWRYGAAPQFAAGLVAETTTWHQTYFMQPQFGVNRTCHTGALRF
jgi:hypothetical protein